MQASPVPARAGLSQRRMRVAMPAPHVALHASAVHAPHAPFIAHTAILHGSVCDAAPTQSAPLPARDGLLHSRKAAAVPLPHVALHTDIVHAPHTPSTAHPAAVLQHANIALQVS